MAVRCGTGDSLTRTTDLPNATTYTFMGWFRLSIDRNDFTAFLHYDGDGSDFSYLGTNGDGRTLQISVLGDSSNAANGTLLNVQQWYHATLVRNGDNFEAFLDGVSDASLTQVGVDNSTKIFVGNNSALEFLNGFFSGIKIWDATLTQAEIQAEMQQIRPVRIADLYGFWEVIAASEVEIDYSGNGRDFTIGGVYTDTSIAPPVPYQLISPQVIIPAAAAPPVGTISQFASSAYMDGMRLGTRFNL